LPFKRGRAFLGTLRFEPRSRIAGCAGERAKRARYTITPMNARLLASGLGFPEGPVVFSDGRLVFCDGNIGELSVYEHGEVHQFAVTGGSPWGAVLGSDGAVYVTQGGNVPGSSDESAVSGIQRVRADGTVELLYSEVDGRRLFGPNDLAFGPDGRLWFTDSGSEHDDRFDVRSPGRLFAVGRDGGEMILELPDVYPNGIAFDRDGSLYWTESMAHRVCLLENGAATVFSQLSDDYVPDGMAFAEDGRAFVCTTISEGVTVLSARGELLEHLEFGEHATNCIFAGSTLYVTATHVAEIEASQRTGTLWAIETDATGGLPLLPGAL
jgi:gluconolactonase